MVKTSPSSAGGTGSILGQGAEIPYAAQPKNQSLKNRNNIVINLKKTLKMVHIKKKILKKEANKEGGERRKERKRETLY